MLRSDLVDAQRAATGAPENVEWLDVDELPPLAFDHNRILAEEFLYARTWYSEQERAIALEVWNRHDNYHRPHSAHQGQPPALATPTPVDNVLASYT